tara:strand:- start:3827 stop:4903 length:1077 start_codon:yes stop_codon:yes gene_type:complete
MVLHTCPRCGYTTHQKNDLRKHYHRKNPCRVDPLLSNISLEILRLELPLNNKNKYTCKICMKKFKRRYNFERHDIERCSLINDQPPEIPCIINNNSSFNTNPHNFSKEKPSISKEIPDISKEIPGIYNSHSSFNIETNNQLNEGFVKKYQSTEEQFIDKIRVKNTDIKNKDIIVHKDILIQTQDIIIKELRDQIEGLVKNAGNKTINNITYNTQIVINPFGKENVGYISQEYITDLIEFGPIKSIPKLLKYIHFNPDHKENHNIKIPNKKQPYASIFNGTKWEISDKKQTIENMTDKAYTILNNHYTGANQYMTEFNEKFEEKEPALTKRIRKDTEIMILNLQNNINKTKTTPQTFCS